MDSWIVSNGLDDWLGDWKEKDKKNRINVA